MDELIQKLRACWDPDDGFFGQLRDGYFSSAGCEEAMDLLSRISQHPEIRRPYLDRNLVRQLWYIPHYMVWQKERLIKKRQIESQEYDNVCNTFLNYVTEILEVP